MTPEPSADPDAARDAADPSGALRPAFLRYCVLAALLAMAPTLLAIALQYLLMAWQGHEAVSLGHPLELPSALDTVGTLLFAPLLETSLLAGMVELARRFGVSRTGTTAICALCWGLLHAVLQGWIKFIPAAWGFLIFTHAYQAWRSRSWRHAYVAALLPHTLVNCAAMAVVFGEAIG